MNDPLKSLPGYALRRASMATMAELARRLEPLGLRFTEASLLQLVAATPGITQSAIGQMLDVQRANMTPLVTRLEQRGILDRRPLDGRTNGLHLTKDGGVLTERLRDVIADFEADLIARVPEEHRASLLPALLALWD